MNTENLILEAKKAADKNKCCGYSNFTVGAALLTKQGKIYSGFNVENHGIQSICAERAAFINALTTGEPANNFEAIAIVGRRVDTNKFTKTVPCGYCRQFMSEYGGADLKVLVEEPKGIRTYNLNELLPEAFTEF